MTFLEEGTVCQSGDTLNITERNKKYDIALQSSVKRASQSGKRDISLSFPSGRMITLSQQKPRKPLLLKYLLFLPVPDDNIIIIIHRLVVSVTGGKISIIDSQANEREQYGHM